MGYSILKTELVDDPLGRGYAAMTDADAAASLNALDRSRQREYLSASEIFEAIVPADYAGLPADKRERVRMVLSLGDRILVTPGSKARAFLADAFGGTSTATSLASMANEPISRATEIGWPGEVKVGDVQNARAS